MHPLSVLVEFWGKFGQQRVADYEHLSKSIQSPGVTFKDLEGSPGDQCLVQIENTWYRARIVSRNGSKYSVFLFDKGIKCNTTTSKLAWGKREHFQLPPEVEFCVLSNVLSLIPENGWSPMALELLRSLTGKSVTAHVDDVLMPHQMFLLHIPSISNQMYEMGLAKKVSPLEFQDFVFKSLKSHCVDYTSPKIRQLSMETSEQLHKKELFMYPELPEGTVETVIVTELANPQRIFCQLKVFSCELKKLTQQITQSCENRMFSCIISPDMIGFPCAAKGSNGKWYRSVLQQVFLANKVVEVLNVDYGTKQLVPLENVRPLASEFFRLPVITYICSLHGMIDKGVEWTTTQIDFLRSLLLFKTVTAKFEYQSISEGVYYVTLYSDDNTNINNLFGSNEGCLLKQENTYVDYAIQNFAYSCQHASLEERNIKMSQQSLEEKEEKGATETLISEELSVNSSHLAVIEHISSPSEFWIQTQKYRKELDQLQDSIYQLYQDSVNTHVLRNPSLGFFCAAKADDGDFYRATVTEVGATQVKVFFVDYGDTRVVDRSDIRALPPEFKNLPKLALKCSLTNVKPKDERWSQSATELFIKEVSDKVLNVHVKAKHNDSYVVKLTDPKAQGKQDISTLLCIAGFAEKADMKHPKVKSATQTAVMSTTPQVAGRVPGLYKNVGFSFQTQRKLDLSSNEGGAATFKEQMFPTGSLLDVSVSYIESPSDFWCQLAQNAWHLRLLMNDLQTYYAGSEFQPDVKTACVARHPENGMWYRALVVRQHETSHVEVLFVDYGQTEIVSLYDLRRICPEFLALHGQAFRCRLLNLTDSTSAANEWNEEAKAKFQKFVETAASNFVILNCTIYAVMYSENKILYNVVDLATPFESICTSLARLVTSLPTMKTTGASLHLNSYYYSTHNVKTGTEERVTVTCVNSVGQFYCHLDRNADTMKDLNTKVNKLCHHLKTMKLPSVFGILCFARYTDGQWYRAQIKTSRPAVLVQFVDYGDTIKVDKADLLPVPKEANEIMSVPVQAVMCSLADMPANVPSEVNNWFEMAVKECEFRALVVARESDGKLQVELYHGSTQINAKIKKMFQIEMQREERVAYQSLEAFEDSANNKQKTPKQEAVDIKNNKQTPKNLCSSEPPCQITLDKEFTDVSHQSSQKHVCPAYESGQKIKHPSLELYVPPHQRQTCGTVPYTEFESANVQVNPKKESFLPETKLLISSGPESKKQNKAEKLPKLTDLPTNSITPGMAADVYISHCSSPFSFYVQRVDEEDEMLSLVEKLNDPESALKAIDIKDLHLGDLIQAEFSDDSSWYRAVVKEIHANAMALIEFIDFGNTAITPISKMGRLQKSVLQLPVYSTHCMLNDAAVLGEEKVCDPAVVSAFKNDIGSCSEKVLKCQFIRQVESVWEVRLEDSGVDVVCKVYSGRPEVITEKQVEEEKVQMCDVRQEAEESLDSCSVRYHQQQELLDGQQLEVYVTAINDTQTFWCQSANSEELDRITESVSEAAVQADGMYINPKDLFPGRPCIALFSDDQLWYRAEVISKDGNNMSVLFVDYGNTSQVQVTDVREIPPLLADIAPQAFLCHLEGFDASCGSWDSSAADQLSLLMADKLLLLTVTRVTRAEVKVQHFVRMEHEGQVINEVMKAWWKCFTVENTPDSVGLTPSFEPTLKLDSTEEQECQQEHHDKHYVDSSHTCIHPESNNIEKLADPLAAGDVSRLASIPKSESSEVSVSFESCAEASKKEHVSGMNVNPASGTTPEDILPHDVGIDQTMLPSLDDKDNQDILCLTCNMTEDIDKGAEDGPGPDGLDSLLEENIVEEMHEPDTETADKEEIKPPIGDIKEFSGKQHVHFSLCLFVVST